VQLFGRKREEVLQRLLREHRQAAVYLLRVRPCIVWYWRDDEGGAIAQRTARQESYGQAASSAGYPHVEAGAANRRSGVKNESAPAGAAEKAREVIGAFSGVRRTFFALFRCGRSLPV
jgi:hypothetical protein